MTNFNFARRAVLGLIAAASVAAPAAAELDLEGKTVEWVIPFSETGGSAKWANFFGPLLSEALAWSTHRSCEVYARRRFDQGGKLVPKTKARRWDAVVRLVRVDPISLPAGGSTSAL